MRQKYLLSMIFLLVVSMGMSGQTEKKNFLLGKNAFTKKARNEESKRQTAADSTLRANAENEDEANECWWNYTYPQLLDSMVQYDETGKVTYRETYTYNEQGYMLKVEGEYTTPYYEVDFDLHLTKIKGEYTYNPGNTGYVMLMSCLQPETGQWVEAFKRETEYNKSGHLLLGVGYNRNASTNTLIPEWKEVYAYNDKNDRTLSASLSSVRVTPAAKVCPPKFSNKSLHDSIAL
ncbi:hypothetical protein LJB84_00715 [Bacteroidales bacterium OttesenSCG-928-J19]|nr:hypothetical protein [Bacteroidales bacterium OttesenSCG-928-J19]